MAKYFFLSYSGGPEYNYIYTEVNSGPKNSSFHQDLDDKSIRLRQYTWH